MKIKYEYVLDTDTLDIDELMETSGFEGTREEFETEVFDEARLMVGTSDAVDAIREDFIQSVYVAVDMMQTPPEVMEKRLQAGVMMMKKLNEPTNH